MGRSTSAGEGCRSVGHEGEGGYTEITGSINMQCVCLKSLGKNLYLQRQ